MLKKNSGPIVLSRSQLYKRVWATPVMRLAREFGISDVALAKACRRRNIPLPPRGFWARRAAGKPVAATPLPHTALAHDRPVIFHAHRVRRSAASSIVTTPAKKTVTAKTALHPIADRLWKTLLLSKPRACGRVRIQDMGLPLVIASPQQATKVAHFFHALLAEAGRRQIDVSVARGATRSLEFCRGKHRVQINIEEDLHPRPGHAFTPSGRLTFQLAVQWKQAADTPAEEIVENLVARMEALLS
jgi:hypothetical protein